MTSISDPLIRKVAYQSIGNLRQQLQDLIDAASVTACGAEVQKELNDAMGKLLAAQLATGAHVNDAELAAAAAALQIVLFGGASTDGTVGFGDYRLHVYVYKRGFGSQKARIANWSGIPVTWHLNVARPKAG